MKWEKVEIKDICEIKSGKRLPKGTNFSSVITQFPYIRARDIKSGIINDKDLAYITENVQKNIKNYIVNTNDIVITIVGASVGDVGFVEEKFNGFNLTENAVRLTNFDVNVNSRYLFYILNSGKYWELMQQIAGGAAQPKLGIYRIETIPLELPPIDIQNRIVSFLQTYDDLIKNNQKQIKLLEEAAQRLYKEWFVDLRFPGYEDVEIVGGLPAGWSRAKLSEIGTVITGKTPSTSNEEFYGNDVPFVKIPDMHNKIFTLNVETYLSEEGANSQKGKYLPPNTLLISCIGTAGLINITVEKCQTNQQINALVLINEKILYYIYYYLKGLQELLQGLGSNGATMTNVNKKKLESILIEIPRYDLLEKFFDYCKPVFDKILMLSKENISLQEARDRLLHRLMSGEVEV